MKIISFITTFIFIIFLSFFAFFVYQNKEKILIELDGFMNERQTNTIDNRNEYYRNYDFNFVKNTNDYVPYNNQDIINIYYSVINSGIDNFTFYCPKEYKNCIKDVKRISTDQVMLSDINNFVHPFNGFSHIETEYDNIGRVTLKVNKSYSEDEILKIEEKVDLLYNSLVNTTLSDRENILKIHDYIINNVKYDSNRSDREIKNYKSDIAYGPLFEGYALCGGYTDLMALFLEKLNIKNYKISSDKHVWNAVYINNEWLHLDLTWDDPVSKDNKDHLEHDYFLINDNELLNKEKNEHTYDINVYSEFK